MGTKGLFLRSLIAAFLVSSLVFTNDALARGHGGGGGGGGGGHGGGGGGSGWSGGGGHHGGGGGGGGNFSRGSSRSGGGGSRSFSGGSSTRSFQGGSSNHGQSFSARSFSGQSGGRSMSNSSARSRAFQAQSGGGSSLQRSSGNRSTAARNWNSDNARARAYKSRSPDFDVSRFAGSGSNGRNFANQARRGGGGDNGQVETADFSARSGRGDNARRFDAVQTGNWERSSQFARSDSGRRSGDISRSGGWNNHPSQDQVRNYLNISGDRGRNQTAGSDVGNKRPQAFDGQGDPRRNVTANWRGSGGDKVADNQFRSSAQSQRNWSNRSSGSANDDGDPRGRGFNRSDDDNHGHGGNGNWAGGSGNGNRGNNRGDGNRGDWNRGNWSGHSSGEFARNAQRTREHWNNEWKGNGNWNGDGRHGDHGDHGDWANHGRHDVPFRNDWWGRHGHGRYAYWGNYGRYHRNFFVGPYFWWGWATGPRISAWFDYGWGLPYWGTPYYWNYGPGSYIYCYNDVIYVNGRWFEPAPQYYEQTANLANSAPELAPEEAAAVDWLPLGVFAMNPPDGKDSDLLVQLAVTKEGVIGGTLYNEATKESFPVEGMVDKKTQRAAWHYENADKANVLMETSVYNLTKPECTAMVHFGPADMQVWQLVRLEAPAEGSAEAIPTPATPVDPNAAAPPADAPDLPVPQAN